MKKKCNNCEKEFKITNNNLKFYKKIGVSVPLLCSECRAIRRFSFVNIQNLYLRKNLISPFSSDKKLNIVLQKKWWSDEIDGKEFGRKFDFNESFFKQFKELQKVAPRWDRVVLNSENCEWGLNMANSKNCYMTRSSLDSENCFYSDTLYTSRDCYDCEYSKKLEFCLDIFDGENCFETFYSHRIRNIQSSALLFDCENCQNCLCSIGLRNKDNYFLNKKISKEKFKELWKKFFQDEVFRKECFLKFKKAKSIFPRRANLILNSENCNGDQIFNSKNINQSFNIRNCEDMKFSSFCLKSRDCFDVSRAEKQELSYETISTYHLYNSKFCFNSGELTDCDYCETSMFLKNCFACVGLKKSEFCILNKQYSKEEYFELREKIIEYMKKTGEWGEFFPMGLSPFGYNETLAQEFFPRTKTDILAKNWKWYNSENSTKYLGPKIIIPDKISDTKDEICNAILTCENCDKNYRIQKMELDFYRKINLSLPKNCPTCRHKSKIKFRSTQKLFDRKCDNCKGEIKTTFAPDRPEKVYCEKCYLGNI